MSALADLDSLHGVDDQRPEELLVAHLRADATGRPGHDRAERYGAAVAVVVVDVPLARPLLGMPVQRVVDLFYLVALHASELRLDVDEDTAEPDSRCGARITWDMERVDALEFVARVLAQIPEPRKQGPAENRGQCENPPTRVCPVLVSSLAPTGVNARSRNEWRCRRPGARASTVAFWLQPGNLRA